MKKYLINLEPEPDKYPVRKRTAIDAWLDCVTVALMLMVLAAFCVEKTRPATENGNADEETILR